MKREPKTLLEAVKYFSDPDNCRDYLVARRWPNGVTCPTCGGQNVIFSEKHNRWQCSSHHAKRQFTLKTGTIFEGSPIGLDKWLAVMWMVVNCKNGISSYEISRAVGVTQKSAWFMSHRVRLALGMESSEKLSGHIEADETYIGGKARNMHRTKLARRVAEFATPRTGRNQNIGKVAVMGLLERHGQIRTMVVADTKRRSLHGGVSKHVEAGSTVYTDALRSYNELDREYIHHVINHAEKYVDGQIHTNGIENFWALLKRGLKGTYISVEPFHLFRYLDEQSFRYNNRKLTDSERFSIVAEQVIGRRLMYAELTGKTETSQP